MYAAPSQTAVLLFSRSAAAEARHKSFGADAAGNARLATALIRRTERMLTHCGLPVVRIDETRQRGADFGTRFTGALADAFALGYEYLIVIGNDAPGLRTSHLRRAATRLETGTDVILPDERGGFALLGISRTRFCAAAFARLPWGTKRLFRKLRSTLPAARLLPALADLNTLADLHRNWRTWWSFLAELRDLLVRSAPAFVDPVLRNDTANRVLAGVRGPPIPAT